MAYDLISLLKMIQCPINILTHIDTCSLYYVEDISMTIIYYIVWILIFIFIYFPIFISVKFLCICVRAQLINAFDWDSCNTIGINDICPSKYFFATLVESLLQIITGGMNLFSRNDDDISMCYCMDPIKNTFNPLEHFENYFYKIEGESVGNSGNNGSFIFLIIICLVIIGFMYYGNKKINTSVISAV